jgi:hypothetical protein
MKASTLLCIGLLATTTAALAQQRLQPGLWEQSMVMQNDKVNQAMAQMQQQMAAMPPEKRKQMEAMMAKQGVSMGGPGQPMTAKVCITPEQAARDEIPARDGKCKQTRSERNGNTFRFAFTCEDGGSGEGEYTLQSPKAHSGKMIINSVRNGKTERMEMQHSGRWLAADCGAVKPLPQPQK